MKAKRFVLKKNLFILYTELKKSVDLIPELTIIAVRVATFGPL